LKEARRKKKERYGDNIVEVEVPAAVVVPAGTAWIRIRRGHLLSEKFLGSLKNSLRR
jgi:hypothetical protein